MSNLAELEARANKLRVQKQHDAQEHAVQTIMAKLTQMGVISEDGWLIEFSEMPEGAANKGAKGGMWLKHPHKGSWIYLWIGRKGQLRYYRLVDSFHGAFVSGDIEDIADMFDAISGTAW